MLAVGFRQILAGTLLLACLPASAQSTWTESSFADFSDGTFFDAGSNIYVSAQGRIQMISRWDLNNDGYLDVILPSGHGHTEKENTYLYLNNGADIDARSRIELPAVGSRDGLLADFNQDGWNDLAVVNYRDSHVGWVDTWVYYGSADGFSADRRSELPAYHGQSIAAGDFNGDGWLDLAIACQWQEGEEENPRGPKMSFIYWNAPTGFQAGKRLPLSFAGQGADAVAAADLDDDQITDLLALASGELHLFLSKRNALNHPEEKISLPVPGKNLAIGNFNHDAWKDVAVCRNGAIILLPGHEQGFDVEHAIELPVSNPAAAAFADFDRDGLDDLVVANHATQGGATWTDSYIFYSDGASLLNRKPLALATLGASGVSAADLNADGFPDIVFSNERLTNQSNLLSYIYWNQNGRFFYGNHTQLPTLGSVANTTGDVNKDGLPDVIFFNTEGGLRDGPATTYIYWGDGSRDFSIQRRLELPTHQLFGVSAADLDDDGAVDLILSAARFHNGIKHDQAGLILQWGSDEGFACPSHLTMVRAYGGVRIADINRDGYLDILSGGRCMNLDDTEQFGFPIFWGTRNGYQQHNRTVLSIPGDRMRAPLLMDLNRDGFLDIAGQIEDGWLKFWWGHPGGFREDSVSELDLGRPDHLMYIQGADLNRDGWLDLLLPHRGPADGTETTSLIYYGSPDGYSNQNRVELPCYVTYQNTIADFNKDGWLDIFLCSYGGEVQGNRPSLIYYGSPDGFFSRPRVELPTHGSSGSLAADFDHDGWLDLLVTNHRKSGSYIRPEPHRHTCPSMLFWGSPDGFSPERRWEAVAVGPSGLNVRDLGNSYDRGLYEDYISSVCRIPSGRQPVAVSWEAATPHGTGVQFQIRTTDSKDRLETASWRGPGGVDTWFVESGAGIDGVRGKWLQYRARLRSVNGAATPYVTSVSIHFE